MPEWSLNRIGDERSPLFRYQRKSFFEAGQDSFSDPPSQNPELFETLENVLPPTTGNLERRWGYVLFNNPGITAIRRMYEYQKDSPLARRLVLTHATNVIAINEDGTAFNANVLTPTGTEAPRMVASRDFAYFANGVAADLKKWDGSATGGVTKWGISAPATAISVGAPVAGSVTLSIGRKYYLVFKNSVTGHHSGLSPISASTGPVTAKDIPLSNLEVSTDAQVDKKVILATKDGGDPTTLFSLVEVTNATLTFTDNVTEATLLTRNVFLETDEFGVERGVADNDVPPNGKLPIKHRGRLYLLDGQFLNFSKSISELTTSTGAIVGRYEEAWPADFELDISEGAEQGRALFSDGVSLYIGTERHVRRLLGDGPENFSKPEVLFNEVGVLNQDVLRAVFQEGAPAGAMWLSSDFRVFFSDFNTYRDIGTPIQDILNGINTAASSKSYATFFSDGEQDWYLLAVPTGANTEPDTVCLYALRLQKWFIWKPTDQTTALLFNIDVNGIPQLLFAAGTGKIYKYRSTDTQDRVGDTPVSFTVTVQTPWLDFGDPTTRKVLNELDLITGDSGLLITIWRASTQADFDAPTAVVTDSAIVTGPRGDFKLYLAGQNTFGRFLRFRFRSTGTIVDVLSALTVLLMPKYGF